LKRLSLSGRFVVFAKMVEYSCKHLVTIRLRKLCHFLMGLQSGNWYIFYLNFCLCHVSKLTDDSCQGCCKFIWHPRQWKIQTCCRLYTMLLRILPFSISKLCYIKIAVTLNEGYLNCLCDRTWIFLQSFYSSIFLQMCVCLSRFNICVLCLLNIPCGLEVTNVSFCSLLFLWKYFTPCRQSRGS
jgi:hypothetical protein